MQSISVPLLSLLLLDGGQALVAGARLVLRLMALVTLSLQESSVDVERGLRYEAPQHSVGGGGGRARPLPAPV